MDRLCDLRPVTAGWKQLKSLFLLDSQPGRSQAMEGLRGYLTLVVFVAHLVSPYLRAVRQVDFQPYADRPLTTLVGQVPWSVSAATYLQRGHQAVDVFFMISAFLVFRIRAHSGDRFSFADFMGKRLLRIYPTALLSLLAYSWLSCWFFQWYPFEGWTFLQNVLFLNGCPGLSVRSVNMVSWSLFYEVFFYLIFPWMYLAIMQLRSGVPQRQFLAAGLLLVAVLFLNAWLNRFMCFYFGILLGMSSDEGLARIARAVPAWFVLLGYLAVIVPFRMALLHPAYIYPFFGLASALLFIKVCYGDGILQRWFSFGPLRFLGNISYSFYLIHILAYQVGSRWIDPLVLGQRWFIAVPVFFGAHFLFAATLGVVLFAVSERWYFWYAHRSRSMAARRPVAIPIDAARLPPATAA